MSITSRIISASRRPSFGIRTGITRTECAISGATKSPRGASKLSAFRIRVPLIPDSSAFRADSNGSGVVAPQPIVTFSIETGIEESASQQSYQP